MPVGKSAVALFVKNDASDVLGWIAWHRALGFDRIFLYDDASEDSTADLARVVGGIAHVEVIAVAQAERNRHVRQGESYLDAIQRARGIFDWIALLDGNDYLTLLDACSIGGFLARFGEEDSAIALNGCVFGSNGHSARPVAPVYEAFTRHAPEGMGDHALVKSIVRPERAAPRYENPHRFSLSGGRYVDAAGRAVSWQSDRSTAVIWAHARINRYVCRSMGHFARRIADLPAVDSHQAADCWTYLNRNDIEAPVDQSQLNRANGLLATFRAAVYQDVQNRYLLASHALVSVLWEEGGSWPVSSPADPPSAEPEADAILRDLRESLGGYPYDDFTRRATVLPDSEKEKLIGALGQLARFVVVGNRE